MHTSDRRQRSFDPHRWHPPEGKQETGYTLARNTGSLQLSTNQSALLDPRDRRRLRKRSTTVMVVPTDSTRDTRGKSAKSGNLYATYATCEQANFGCNLLT